MMLLGSIVPIKPIEGIYMRLLIPLFFGLLGAVVGVIICRLFVRSWLAYPAAAIIGALSAFVGLFLRDIFDATLVSSSPLLDSLFAALTVSLVVSVLANIVTSIVSEREKPEQAQTDRQE